MFRLDGAKEGGEVYAGHQNDNNCLDASLFMMVNAFLVSSVYYLGNMYTTLAIRVLSMLMNAWVGPTESGGLQSYMNCYR